MSKSLQGLKFFIHTFGCQMNENDSEHISGLLTGAGSDQSASLEDSDIIILNTCAVREKAEEKLYSYLGRLSSFAKKKKVIVGVVGCVAQLYRSEILEKWPFIQFVLGPDNYHNLPEVLLDNLEEKFVATGWSREWNELSPALIVRESLVSAYVTIMEGCDNFCSYCVVPFTRGREKFRSQKNIILEIKDLAQRGYKEIQLLGQNVNSYVNPETGRGFPTLLQEVAAIEGIEWVRFITSHPKNFNLEIAETMEENGKICRQLHLPLQAGSSAVLQRMNRGYTREHYFEIVSMLRELLPTISLSTDIIVGFPGETEKNFEETLVMLEEIKFCNIFSFRYSPRPHAAASRMKDDVPLEDKRRRLLAVQELQKRIQLELHKAYMGKTIRVLCLGKSKKDAGMYSGRNEGYQVVNFKSQQEVTGQFVDILITGYGPYSLHGEYKDPSSSSQRAF
jgi:tRNA-2-methylthio-N6-dimethylallyladenosine synthase